MPLYGHTYCFVARGKTICGENLFMSQLRKFPKNSCFHTNFTLLPLKNHIQTFLTVSLYLVISYWNHNVATKPRVILTLEACRSLQLFYN